MAGPYTLSDDGTLDTETVYCDLVLMPHRSLQPRSRAIYYGGLATAATLATIFSAKAGAWPVGLALDIAFTAAAGAMALSTRSGREYQTLRLTDRFLEVAHYRPYARTPAVTRWSPFMIRVEVTERADSPERLLLHSSGRTIEIGAFLPPDEKPEVAREIRAALDRMAPRSY